MLHTPMSVSNKKFSAISLFSGALGLDIGIKKAGFDVRVCVENDPFAVETIKLNTKIPVIARDITTVETAEILSTAGLKKEQVDLVFGGPPCQAFSTAGARRSVKDFRGNLIMSFLRVVKEVRPKTFLLENVRGLLSSKLNDVPFGFSEYKKLALESGSVIYFLYKEFDKLGYKISFSLFDSANYGVPQRRERVLMFGTLANTTVPLPKPTHSRDGATGKRWVSIREAFLGMVENRMTGVDFREKHLQFLKKLHAGQYWKHLSKSDQKIAMGKAYFLQGGKTGFYRRLDWEKPSPALLTSPVMPATMLCHPERLRPLSIQEYARIQMFPDEWVFAGKPRNIYKLIGNAVPVGLGEAAGRELFAHLKGLIAKDQIDDKFFSYSRYRGTEYFHFIPQFENRVFARAGLLAPAR